MKNSIVSPTLEQFDLLPPSYRYHDRLYHLRRSWLAVALCLTVVLCGAALASFQRFHRQRKQHAQLAMTAVPLKALREDVLRLQDENRQRSQWCQWVESARPDDSALQALAAIAGASQTGDGEILIDSLHLRLSVESPSGVEPTPKWAQPKLEIQARARTNDGIQHWIDRLSRLDRLEQASLKSGEVPSSESLRLVSGRLIPVQLTALPRATRVLP